MLLAAAIAYYVLQQTIIASQGEKSVLRAAVGADWKGKLSPFMYVLGIASTFIWSPLAQVFYISVALIWLVPDKRIERTLHSH